MLEGTVQLPPSVAWLAVTGAAVTAVVTTVLGVRRLWKQVVHPTITAIIRVYHSLEKLERSWPLLDELKPNGGSTLRDAIDRIEKTVHIKADREEAYWDYQGIAWMCADSDGNVTEVSRAWAEITGLNLEESEGTGWLRAVHRDDRQSVLEQWRTTIQGCVIFEADFRILWGGYGSKVKNVYVRANPIKVKGKLESVYGFMRLKSDGVDDLRTSLDRVEVKLFDLESKYSEAIRLLRLEIHSR